MQVPRLSDLALQHLRKQNAPDSFLAPGHPRTTDARCHARRRCHTQGLATLSADSAFRILRNLFQFLTLLGFALQSFHPCHDGPASFRSRLPFLRFSTNPDRIGRTSWRRSNGFHPRQSRHPFGWLPNWLDQGGHRGSPELFGLSGFLYSSARHESLSHTVPLSPFGSTNLTAHEPRSPRDSCQKRSGVFP